MLWFSLLIGSILAIAGIATYYLAPRVGPNPIFGVRIGYAFASREIWDATNRIGGILIAFIGIGMAMLGMLLQLLNIAPRDGMTILTVVMLAMLLGGTGGLFFYARRLAQGTPMARELAPVRFRWIYIVPALVTFALLVALAAYWYPTLPERMAVHFNIAEQPDGWQARGEFLVTYLGLAALFILLNLAAVFIATREPLIAFGRWGKTWRLDPARGLLFTSLAFALANLILLAVLWNVVWFNTQGVHAFSYWLILWLIVPLIALIVGLFFALARREG